MEALHLFLVFISSTNPWLIFSLSSFFILSFILMSPDDSFFIYNINNTKDKELIPAVAKQWVVCEKCGNNLEKHYCSNTNNNNTAALTPLFLITTSSLTLCLSHLLIFSILHCNTLMYLHTIDSIHTLHSHS